MTIPFVDLPAQQRSLQAELEAVFREVIGKCDFILGDAVDQFEKEFAAFVGARHAIGVGSGLEALKLSLKVAGIGIGDEVIIPANTFIATALAVSAVGATPVLVDIDEATFNIAPPLIVGAITTRTKAIIPVHLYGQPCDMDEIMAIAQQHKLVVIEDACQAHGAKYKGHGAGAFGLTGCFSFYPAKNLGACGDGGAIVTNNDAVAMRLRRLRNYGQECKYVHIERGVNTRLDTMQAAILRIKLRHLGEWNQARVRHAARYSAQLRGVQTPVVAPNRTHIFHLYVIRISRRDALQKQLTTAGIQTGIHYPIPIHLQQAYAALGKGRGSFPVTERLADEILSLPMFAELSDLQIDFICAAVQQAGN